MIGARRARRSAGHDPHDVADLTLRIRAGDQAAESELVARYRAGVLMLLRSLMKDAALADDLAQEVFRIALESLRNDRVDEPDKLSAYIWGIARNLARVARRRQQRRREVALDDTLIDHAVRQDHQLLREERARLVRDALSGLSPRDREVLRAFYLAGTPKAAICRALALTPAQFDLIKFRALKRLRPLVGMGELDNE